MNYVFTIHIEENNKNSPSPINLLLIHSNLSSLEQFKVIVPILRATLIQNINSYPLQYYQHFHPPPPPPPVRPQVMSIL